MQTKHVFIGAKQGTGFGNLTEKEDKPKLCSLATMDPQSLGRAENASSVPQSVFGGLPGLEQSTPIPAIRTPQSFPANSTSRTHPSTLSIPVETETMERPSRTNDHTSIPTRQDRDLTAVTSNFASVRHVVPVIAYSNQGPEMRLSASFSPMSDGDVCKTNPKANRSFQPDIITPSMRLQNASIADQNPVSILHEAVLSPLQEESGKGQASVCLESSIMKRVIDGAFGFPLNKLPRESASDEPHLFQMSRDRTYGDTVGRIVPPESRRDNRQDRSSKTMSVSKSAEPLIDTPTFFASSLQTDAGYMAQMRVESKPHTQRFPFEAQGGGSLAVAHGDTGRELHTDKAFDSDGLRRESVHSESSLFHKRFGQGEQSSENQRGAQGAIMAKFQQFDSDGDDSIHDRTMINNPAERAREHSVQQTVLDTLSMLSRHSGNEANTMSLRGILQTNAAGPRSSSDGNLERSSFEVADSSSFADPKPLDAADVNNRNQRSLGTTHSFLTVESDGYRPAASRDVEEKNAALSAQERNAKTKNIEAETSSATFPRKRASRSFPILAVAGEELVTEDSKGRRTRASRRRHDDDGNSSQPSIAGTGSPKSNPIDYTYFGYIEDVTDAQLVIEGCVRKRLKKFSSNFDTSTFDIISGIVVVILEAGMRWRDKLTWSPSRAYGPFLLYREVETAEEASQTLVNAKFRGLTRSIGIDSGIAPTFSSKTLKPGTRVVENGFTKRTITLTGSDGLRYRLISYAKADDIRKIRLNATDRSEAYRTLSDEPVLEGDVPALTRPSHDDKFRKYPGFPSPPEKVIDKRTRKKSLSDSVEEPLRLLVKKPKWRQKSASPTDFPIFEPQLEYPCSQASLSLANGTSLVHRSADATSSLSQMRQTSTSVANATTDTVTTQSTFMTSTAPAPPPSIHMMRAPEHGVPSGHLHHPYYYAGPPPVQSEMHPAYPHPNFVAQQPQPVMYTYVEQPRPYAAYPTHYPEPPTLSVSTYYPGQASHLNLAVPIQGIPSSFVAHHNQPRLSHSQQDPTQSGMPAVQYPGYQPPPHTVHMQSAHSMHPYFQYPHQPEPDPRSQPPYNL